MADELTFDLSVDLAPFVEAVDRAVKAMAAYAWPVTFMVGFDIDDELARNAFVMDGGDAEAVLRMEESLGVSFA